MDSDAVEHHVWTLPAQFFVMRYINDGKYIPGDEARELKRARNELEINVTLHKPGSPEGPPSFYSHTFPALGALQNVAYGKELYCSYGSSYSFNTYLIYLIRCLICFDVMKEVC